MFSSIIHRNTRSLARIELSDEQIRNQAPSIFAAAPAAGVSERYTFLPTAQIVGRMRQEGWAPVEVQQQAVRVEGRMGFQKHVIRFQRRDEIAKPGEFTPEIALVNSHDRSSAYQIHTALYRFVCANGLMVSDSTIEPVSIRHTGRETEEVIAASFSMLAQLPRVTEKVEAFRARQMTPTEQHIFAEQALKLRWEDLRFAPVGVEKILWSDQEPGDCMAQGPRRHGLCPKHTDRAGIATGQTIEARGRRGAVATGRYVLRPDAPQGRGGHELLEQAQPLRPDPA
jgi:hypothetical protein